MRDLERNSLSRVGRNMGFDINPRAERISELGIARSWLSFADVNEDREMLKCAQSWSNWGEATVRQYI